MCNKNNNAEKNKESALIPDSALEKHTITSRNTLRLSNLDTLQRRLSNLDALQRLTIVTVLSRHRLW